MEHAHYNQIKSWTFCGSLSFKPSPAAFDLSRQSHEISCLRKAQGKFFVFKESKFLWEASKRVKIFLWNKKTLIARKGSFPIEERLPFKKREEFGSIEKDLMDETFDELQDKFSGVRVIKIFNQEPEAQFWWDLAMI